MAFMSFEMAISQGNVDALLAYPTPMEQLGVVYQGKTAFPTSHDLLRNAFHAFLVSHKEDRPWLLKMSPAIQAVVGVATLCIPEAARVTFIWSKMLFDIWDALLMQEESSYESLLDAPENSPYSSFVDALKELLAHRRSYWSSVVKKEEESCLI